MRKNKDVKFIIYQSLYIFVVCVIAIKGANLDLVQVMENDTTLARISEDSLRHLLEILKISKLVDTNLYIIISKEDLAKMDVKQRELMQQLSVQNVTLSTTSLTQIQPKIEENPKIEQKKMDPGEMKEIRIGNIEFTQYTMNTLNNPYDSPLEVSGVTSIPPKSSKSFELGSQITVVVKVGDVSKTINVKPNQKPKINIQRIASMGEDTRVTQLQSSVGFRVTIDDDFPGQLEVKFSGPITVKQQGSTYDITMNAFGSKSAFDNYTDNKNSPYSVGFTVTVKDKIAPHQVTAQQSFMFGEW